MAYKANTKKRARTDFLVVHCAATKPSANIGAYDIDRWHRAQGWFCIGYHYVIRRDGTVEEGRDLEVIGAHVSGHNEYSVGICMAGGVSEKDVNVPENNFTPAQLESLKKLLLELRTKYPKARIQGHRDFPGVKKACPSFDVASWLKAEGIPNP
ncbi:N-acetylmuramoyl-L-alanine amidase [Bordetella phage vB_BbrP_BB8]|uniref:N-acetylmuramoyl-L-alanine amidase n=1 Tax=Bordetella phage vB_BbrP_BB8 TaxID=2587820 RepID=A0A4Y5TPP8_9CAUD|nr:N-acetylmuramoyl-L-alanine amidase [Bordetella phage vB_BbrP_BB8]